MGESYGRWQLGNDTELMQYIPTINVAGGFHAGDPDVMWRTMEAAARAGVEVGAHVAIWPVMVRWLGILIETLRSTVRTHRELAPENLALRQQLAVWKASPTENFQHRHGSLLALSIGLIVR